MYYYDVYNMLLESKEPISSLTALSKDKTSNKQVDITLDFKSLPQEFHTLVASGYSSGSRDNENWFCNQYGIFYISNGNYIQVELYDTATPEEAYPYILGYCLSHLAVQRSMLSIHCSGIRLGNASFIISGYSGSGKSTLSNALLSEGAFMINDDMAIITPTDKEAIIFPGIPQQKLCRNTALEMGYDLSTLKYIDEEKDKFSVECAERFYDKPSALQYMFWLCPSDKTSDVVISEVNGFKKLNAVLNNLFLSFKLKKTGITPEQMQLCLSFASKIKIYKIIRPLDKDTSSEIKSKVIKIIGEQ